MQHHLPFVWYVKIGTKITASVEREFRLQAVPEDDTIYLPNIGISSEISYRLGASTLGRLFFM